MNTTYNHTRGLKRPHAAHDRTELPAPKTIPQSAYVQAYEAQLVYGQTRRAEELYSKEGRGLMRWQGEDEDIWADRHDILHLLTDVPNASSSTRRPSMSPRPSPTSSWASLPSDLEETFQMSDPEEIAEYERIKRTRQIAGLREARLREREEEDRQIASTSAMQSGMKSWPEEEIPPHATLTLMSHTAVSLLKSPNPKVLESRILMNHTSDERFEFLRGRWRLTWERTKKDAKAKHDLLSGKGEKEKKNVGSLIGGYESSEEEEDDDEEASPPSSPPPLPPPEMEESPSPGGDDSVHAGPLGGARHASDEGGSLLTSGEEEERQRMRRSRVEEWKRKRAQATAES